MKATQFIEWLFRSPFLWMTLLGVVSSHSINRFKIMVSLPYAPLIEDNEDYTRNYLVMSFLAGIIGSVFLYFTNTIPDLNAVIGIWIVASILMMAKKDPIALLVATFVTAVFLFISGNHTLVYKAIRYGAIYQLLLGILFLVGKKDTYPVMQQDKEGNVFGEHIYSRMWLFPAIAFSTISDVASYITYILLVMLLMSNIKINKQNVKTYFKNQGLFIAGSGALILAISFIRVDIVEYILLFGILPSCIIAWIVWQTIKNKNTSYYFVADDKGLQVFYIYDNTPASFMKLEIGDIILNINGRRVITENAMSVVLDDYPPFVWLEIQRGEQIFEVEYKDYKKGINSLGAVYTSRNPSKFEVYSNTSFFKNFLYKCTSIFKH